MNQEEQKNNVFPQKSVIPEEISKRITSLRFLLIVFVVFLHVLTVYDNTNLWIFIRTSFLNVCNTAVPLFFLFASYLQFRKEDKYCIKKACKEFIIALYHLDIDLHGILFLCAVFYTV